MRAEGRGREAAERGAWADKCTEAFFTKGMVSRITEMEAKAPSCLLSIQVRPQGLPSTFSSSY